MSSLVAATNFSTDSLVQHEYQKQGALLQCEVVVSPSLKKDTVQRMYLMLEGADSVV